MYKPKLTHKQRKIRRKEIASNIKKGMTPKQAQHHYKITMETVKKACTEFNVTYKNPRLYPRNLTSFQILAELLKTPPIPLRLIADQFGITHQAVSEIGQQAIDAGITLPKRKSGRRRTRKISIPGARALAKLI